MGRALPAVLFCAAIVWLVGCKSKSARPGVDGAARDTAIGDVVVSEPSNEPTGSVDMRADVMNGDAATLADRLLCQGVCDFTANLQCSDPSGDCVGTCQRSLADPLCGASARLLYVCRFAIGPSAYTCMAGMVVLAPGVCQAEVEAFRLCRTADGGR